MRRFKRIIVFKFIILLIVTLSIFLIMLIWMTNNFSHKKFKIPKQVVAVAEAKHQLKVLPIPRPEKQNSSNNNKVSELISPAALRKDWHDYKAMYRDLRHRGLGEQGRAAKLNYGVDNELQKNLSLFYGYNALLSDAISLDRSLLDVRNKNCLHKKYLSKLPTVSIIMPFYNEYFSVLMRSVHSLWNRTPPELLKEIILIDDFSDRLDLGAKLDDYVKRNLKKVQIIRLPQRMGLIRARMAGIRQATAEVLVILDSHIEVNYNWLPPLLEPIALNKRTVMCPITDSISYENFQYGKVREGRGVFDWSFRYISLKLLPEDLLDRTKPYKSPVMNGGLFAITTAFFWELGGYDEGLDIWGGEQYELSFKIWMCGGQMLEAPCSRVGHLYRNPSYQMENPRNTDYLRKNLKRVAEVWMDEYKNYIYERSDGLFQAIDEGDLTAQKALRQELQCKTFKWYMENVAFDLLQEDPPVEPPEYAYGAIQNVADPNFCVDTLNNPLHSFVGLFQCAQNLTHPQGNQNFALTWRRDLRLRRTYTCLEVHSKGKNAKALMWTCDGGHAGGDNQLWYFDRENKWITYGRYGKRCLEASATDKQTVYVNNCERNNLRMQWNFGMVNNTALDGFFINLKWNNLNVQKGKI